MSLMSEKWRNDIYDKILLSFKVFKPNILNDFCATCRSQMCVCCITLLHRSPSTKINR